MKLQALLFCLILAVIRVKGAPIADREGFDDEKMVRYQLSYLNWTTPFEKKFCVPLTLIIRKIQGFSQFRRPVKRWIQDNQVDLSLYKAKDVEAFFRTIGYRCARLVATFQQYIQVTHLT